MRNYYLEQSHGAYTVRGDIKDWVKLDLPESYYGANSAEGTDDLTGPVWRVARDAIAKFAAENPGFDWAQYDQENPYGITGADFNQPDGYLDHLILVHAGSDESAGGGAQLTDAIWAHSWDIYENLSGGPGDGPGMMIPGTEGQGPQGKGIWAYNYTINPEDGDVGVFCHEFGHDLGLPDEYDYSSATGDATHRVLDPHVQRLVDRPPVGPRLRAGGDERVGQVRARLRAAQGRQARPHRDRQAPGGGDRRRGLHRRQDRTAAGPGTRSLSAARTAPGSGTPPWATTSTPRSTSRTRSQVGAGTDLSFRTWYDIEDGYDYGFVEVSADDGQTWDTVKQYTGSDMDHWADVQTVDLSAYEGKSVRVRFEYMTDGGVALKGWELTDIADRRRRAAAVGVLG